MTPELLEIDPENKYLARSSRDKLTAEMIRDNALAVSRLLVDKIGGPSVKPYQPEGLWAETTSGQGLTKHIPDTGDNLYRRSLYTFWKRTVSPPAMTTFDAASRGRFPQQHYDSVGTWRKIIFTYANGCQIILDGENSDKNIAYIESPNGKIYNEFKSTIPNLKELIDTMPDPEEQIASFDESVRTCKKFALNEENGHRSATIVNMGVIALRLGRTLKFDPVKQEFIDDEEANRLIDQPMRGTWRI